MIKPIRTYRAGSGYFKAIIKSSITPFQYRGRAAKLLGLSGKSVISQSVYSNLPFHFHYLTGAQTGYAPNLLLAENEIPSVAATNPARVESMSRSRTVETPPVHKIPPPASARTVKLSERPMPQPASYTTHSHSMNSDPTENIRRKLTGLDVREMILKYQDRYVTTASRNKNFVMELSRLLERQNYPAQKPPSASDQNKSAASVSASSFAEPGNQQVPTRPPTVTSRIATQKAEYIVPGQRLPPMVKRHPNSELAATDSLPKIHESIDQHASHTRQFSTPASESTATTTSHRQPMHAAANIASYPQDLPYIKLQTAAASGVLSTTEQPRDMSANERVTQGDRGVQTKHHVIRLVQGGSVRTHEFADGSDFFTRNYIGHPSLILYK